MPISRDFTLPSSPDDLDIPAHADAHTFLIFISSNDPQTRQPWCPDVRASWPHVVAAFESQISPTLNVVEVGQRSEWNNPDNVFRKNWSVNTVPTLVKYRRLDGKVVEASRLDETGIMNVGALHAFLN
ncbi:hypothetical protein E4U41_007365 [Claviceps citrina]|nr:hypothetical protein E4U41_007365 [Claviceps citrina]